MKLIAISQRVDFINSRGEYRDSLDQSMHIFINHCGYTLFPIPNKLGISIEELLKDIPISGIILSGGNNIGDYIERDKRELELIDYSLSHFKPILGICRGMQMLANWYGIGLLKVKNHVNVKHQVHGEIDTMVNSYHDYAISRIPEECDLLASSPDGVIEGFISEKNNWEAWMWHPERDEEYNPIFIKRIQNLFQ
tara:strand:+ start:574 stop:1158 length:585 start_codon:yes stop_codon:yes gene_type:complete